MSHLLQDSSILMTGGAGTLGLAIAERRKREGWTGKMTVYSTDNHKHDAMRRLYPNVNFVQGDIRNAETLFNAMVGHDVVLHLAAVKVIPASEYDTLDTIDVNVNGSINVCIQSYLAGVKHVLGISTDKACHPANAYGSTKHLMEKIFCEYSRIGFDTSYHLIRYGNVLESNGSVIEAWKRSVANGEPINVTDPRMTRFWLSPQQAVTMVISSLELESGNILIPKMKALPIGKLAEYVLPEDFKVREIPLRPGEKMNETLLTEEECKLALEVQDRYILYPTTSGFHNPYHLQIKPFTSDIADELTKDELLELLRNE